MDKVNMKSAPRRTVVRIDREGAWGRVEYVHELDCGHSERRKRPAKTGLLACSWCVVAEQKAEQLRELAVVPTRTQPSVDDDLLDELGMSLAMSERELAKLKASLAAKFDVPLDAVDVVVEDNEGVLGVSYAVVFLDAGQISAILRGE